jgi:hypothetical protein
MWRWSLAGFLTGLGIFAPTSSLRAGECVGAMDGPAIMHSLSGLHPDSLTHEAIYMLGCLDSGVDQLEWRGSRELLPSWRLLRNTRREYRDLGRYPGLRDVIQAFRSSPEPRISSSVTAALALYGVPIDPDTLSAAIPHLTSKVMTLAVIGDTTGVPLATEAYSSTNDHYTRIVLLDALYYQCTPEALEFIKQVAANPDDVAADRARWMLEHPFEPEAAWKL